MVPSISFANPSFKDDEIRKYTCINGINDNLCVSNGNVSDIHLMVPV